MNSSHGKIIAMLMLVLTAAGVCSVAMQSSAEKSVTREVERPEGWREKLEAELPVFGHRNWIVIADSAYPKQSAPAIETIWTGAGQLEVLDTVLQQIATAPHVQPLVYLDAELDNVPEEHAPGVEAYRKQLKQQLKGKQIQVLPHEQIIAELDRVSKLFNVLVLKTDMVIPYTSVFLQLDCGYWDADKEKALRDALRARNE